MSDACGRAALDPGRSVVVRACAGSGKTWLLVSRIVRLLLSGAEPSSILALTFTRKATLEMRSRLNEWLRTFATAEDAVLRAELRTRHVPEAEVDTAMLRARGLFERIATGDGGVTIDTFHGWFLHVLRHAPLEAATGDIALLDRVGPTFEEAWRHWAWRAGPNGDAGLAEAFDFLVGRYDLHGTHQLLGTFVGERPQWWALADGRADPIAHALAQVRSVLRADVEDDPLQLVRDGSAWLEGLAEFGDLLGRLNLPKFAPRVKVAHEAVASAELDERFALGYLALLTRDGEPFSLQPQAKRIRDMGPAGERLLLLKEGLTAQYLDALEHRRERDWLAINEAVFRCGTALLDEFQAAKRRRGLLDFTDIEWQARQLLARSEAAAFVLHRMDARYRHVLVDEFQDTNPLQWQALLAWLRASHEAEHAPSLFLVGDPKQSIYRFRRADARLFERAADYLQSHHAAEVHEMNVSRRCAPAILDAVNAVFGAAGADFAGFVPHEAHRRDLPGRVERLPLAPGPGRAASGRDPDAPLRDPLSEPLAEDEERARAEEARAVAQRIRDIVDQWAVDADGGTRRARYGDVMLLLRTRRHVMAFEEAFRAQGIPHVTSRKGGLLDRLEVLDIEALLRFLVAPFSDLDLARVLRSPLFSASDDELLQLAHAGAGTWWDRLGRLAPGAGAPATFARAFRLLTEWRDIAPRLPVHDLLDRIYFSGDVLDRYAAAVAPPLREGARANLLALLELALGLDAGRYPSLQRFLDTLAELRGGAAEEAPDEGATVSGEDAVRILTIHGAKGLEAPVVFLADCNGMEREESYEVLVDWPPDSDVPVWFAARTRKADDPAVIAGHRADERAAAAREELNALYVAMTRAKQVLVVSGSESGRRSGEPSWYQRIDAALAGLTGAAVLGQDLGAEAPDSATPVFPGTDPELPDARWLTPHPAGSRGHADDTSATVRGERVHWLLEQLAPPEAIDDEVLLQRLAGTDDTTFREDLRAAQTILRSPELRPFLDPAQYDWARNEVSFATGDGELRRMDRVVRRGGELWVLDYKTGEGAAGASASDNVRAHLDQMREYARAAAALYPGLTIRVALVLAGGVLRELPGKLLAEGAW